MVKLKACLILIHTKQKHEISKLFWIEFKKFEELLCRLHTPLDSHDMEFTKITGLQVALQGFRIALMKSTSKSQPFCWYAAVQDTISCVRCKVTCVSFYYYGSTEIKAGISNHTLCLCAMWLRFHALTLVKPPLKYGHGWVITTRCLTGK